MFSKAALQSDDFSSKKIKNHDSHSYSLNSQQKHSIYRQTDSVKFSISCEQKKNLSLAYGGLW